MNQESEIMVEFGMQGRLRGAVARTILEFLKAEMEGSDTLVRRKSLKERLGLAGIGCCGGATWRPSSAAGESTLIDEEDEHGVVVINMEPTIGTTPESTPPVDCFGQTPVRSTPLVEYFGQTPGRSTMNLAAALAAERQYRADRPIGPSEGLIGPNRMAVETPRRVSLMRLLEETDGWDEKVVVGNESVCCVCMVRKRGAAFIPCGHTFCRVCSRELWLNRGTCPLCIRSIIEILDIF
ncbi:hypothetical protein LIER_19273 [Lithospermum erythrorhizon]|uniref:RING-type domain-containing protein n=1 Tax=Lithospermum erythrorhizon TaxID=34254 RepID=A0AAV3QMQ2_LITER